MRGIAQETLALMQGFVDEAHFALLEVAQPAMDQLAALR